MTVLLNNLIALKEHYEPFFNMKIKNKLTQYPVEMNEFSNLV